MKSYSEMVYKGFGVILDDVTIEIQNLDVPCHKAFTLRFNEGQLNDLIGALLSVRNELNCRDSKQAELILEKNGLESMGYLVRD